MIPRLDPEKPIQEDFIAILNADGIEKKRVSLIECFENSEKYSHILYDRKKRGGDIFHTNSLEVLDGRLSNRVAALRSGNILTSMRYLNVLAVVDIVQERIV